MPHFPAAMLFSRAYLFVANERTLVAQGFLAEEAVQAARIDLLLSHVARVEVVLHASWGICRSPYRLFFCFLPVRSLKKNAGWIR